MVGYLFHRGAPYRGGHPSLRTFAHEHTTDTWEQTRRRIKHTADAFLTSAPKNLVLRLEYMAGLPKMRGCVHTCQCHRAQTSRGLALHRAMGSLSKASPHRGHNFRTIYAKRFVAGLRK